MNGEYLTTSVEQTRELARQFAAGLRPGDTVCLTGPLGAGKTEFMRGITEVFGCDDQLSSPTFSLLNIYDGSYRGTPVELHHFDLYRLESEKELESAGFEEYLSGPFVAVVEWGEKFPACDRLYTRRVVLEPAGERQRKVTIS